MNLTSLNQGAFEFAEETWERYRAWKHVLNRLKIIVYQLTYEHNVLLAHLGAGQIRRREASPGCHMAVTRLESSTRCSLNCVRLAHTTPARIPRMGKRSRGLVGEEYLHLPPHTSASAGSTSICDTHTHLLSTFSEYTMKYLPSSAYMTVYEFVRGLYCSDTPPPVLEGKGASVSYIHRGK